MIPNLSATSQKIIKSARIETVKKRCENDFE